MGMATEACTTMIRRAQNETAIEMVPAIKPSRALSVSNWRTRRRRLAPRDSRTPISRRRAAERASCMPATLAQAMSRTSPTEPRVTPTISLS